MDFAAPELTSSLTPVHRLPRELLEEIFYLSLSVTQHRRRLEYRTPSMEVFDTSDSPWTLSHVCRRWRAIATTTSSLWSCLELDLTELHAYPNSRFNHLLEVSLHRSYEHHLSVQIGWDDEDDGGPFTWTAFIESIMSLLLSSSHRWISLEAFLPLQCFTFFNFVHHTFPSLQKLDLGISSGELTPGGFDFFARCAPRLSSVAFGEGFEVYLYDLLAGEGLPLWSQIHELEVYHNVDAYNLTCTLLDVCPNLLHLHVAGEVLFPIERQDSVIHRTLEALTIHWNAWSSTPRPNAFQLLDRLIVPSLRTVTFQSDWMHTPLNHIFKNAPESINGLIQRSGCAITRLHVDSMPVSEDHFLALLAVIPTIEDLLLSPMYQSGMPASYPWSLSHTFLRRLTYTGEPHENIPLLPNLVTLVLADRPNLDFGISIADMVESRWRLPSIHPAGVVGVTQLRKICLVLEDDLHPETVDRLRAMMNEGLQVHVSIRRWIITHPALDQILP